MDVLEILKRINAYPIPFSTIVETAVKRELSIDEMFTKSIAEGKAYNLSKADLLMWLSSAPDISQGGQSYSFTDEQRKQFRNEARQLYDDFGEDEQDVMPKTIYGYKGDRL